jgi:transposase
VIGSTRQLRVFAYSAPCDMRKHYDSLGAIVRGQMGQELISGDLYLFIGKNRKRAKVLYFDGTGLCLLAKRLEMGKFAALWEQSERCELSLNERGLFLEGSEFVGQLPLSPRPYEPSERLLAWR